MNSELQAQITLEIGQGTRDWGRLAGDEAWQTPGLSQRESASKIKFYCRERLGVSFSQISMLASVLGMPWKPLKNPWNGWKAMNKDLNWGSHQSN